ncbi:MAG: hypothetical protein ACREDR_29625 [Blastocatellia bacterium]
MKSARENERVLPRTTLGSGGSILPVSFPDVTDFHGRNIGELYVFPGVLYFIPSRDRRIECGALGALIELGLDACCSFAHLLLLVPIALLASTVGLERFKSAEHRVKYRACGGSEVLRQTLDNLVEADLKVARASGDYDRLLSSATRIAEDRVRAISITPFGTLKIRAGGPEHDFRVGFARKRVLSQALAEAGIQAL